MISSRGTPIDVNNVRVVAAGTPSRSHVADVVVDIIVRDLQVLNDRPELRLPAELR